MKPGVTCQKLVSLNKISPVTEKTHLIHRKTGGEIYIYICPYVRSWKSLEGYFATLTWVCTALYHSSTLLLSCLKLVSRSNLAHTSLDWGLQNPSNLPQIVFSVNWSVGKPQDTYWSIPKLPDQAMTFLHVVFLIMLQAYIPGCSHTLDTTLRIYGTSHC